MMNCVALASVVSAPRVGLSLNLRMNFRGSQHDLWEKRTRAQKVRSVECTTEVELNICEEEGERWDGLA
jgi:hypothetical protein